MLIGVGLTLGLIALLALVKYQQISTAIAQSKNMGPPPTTVTSFVAEEQAWPNVASASGSLAASQGAMLSAEETGRISNIAFTSGQRVEKGAVLLEMDVSVETSQLKGASAALSLAKINAERQRALRAKNANAPGDLDAAEAALLESEAEVARLTAVINRKRVIAPFAGTLGIKMVNVGQTVMSGAEIVSLNSSDPLFVNFSLPQHFLSKLKPGASVEVFVDGIKDPFLGSLTAIDSQVDPKTRTIALQATIANSEERLRPGMFADIEVSLGEPLSVVAIPASSVSYAPYGDSVYVIDSPKDGKESRSVSAKTIVTGARLGDMIAVVSGLKAGDEVVSSGTFMLRPNAEVFVNSEIDPGANLNPNPQDT
jgi:membrane fusion protein (multidrug efflux system)